MFGCDNGTASIGTEFAGATSVLLSGSFGLPFGSKFIVSSTDFADVISESFGESIGIGESTSFAFFSDAFSESSSL